MSAASDDVDVDTMSIKALREFITSAGLKYTDCLEKSDLINRAKEAKILKSQKEVNSTPDFTKKTFAGYECTLSKNFGENDIDLVVILLHGFGATSDEFRFLHETGEKLCPQKKIAWVFPQAHQGSQGAAEWWQLDAMKWFGAAQQGEASLAALIREVPPGLNECRESLKQLISEVQSNLNGIGLEKLVLAGFSQGAMTAMDLALQLDVTIGGVIMLSGAPIVVDQWAESMKSHQGINVFISHGRNDPIMPYATSGWCHDLLKHGGAQVVRSEHAGGHEVGPTTMNALMTFLAER